MATVHRHMTAPPAAVFDVLSDGWLYAIWVVGASRMRDVDAGWPAAGTRIHHSVGAWPLLIDDETEVIAVDRPNRLELCTRARPLGVAEVVLDIAAAPGGSMVTMHERPVAGPGRWVHNPLSDALLRLRNVEALDRLALIVANRPA